MRRVNPCYWGLSLSVLSLGFYPSRGFKVQTDLKAKRRKERNKTANGRTFRMAAHFNFSQVPLPSEDFYLHIFFAVPTAEKAEKGGLLAVRSEISEN